MVNIKEITLEEFHSKAGYSKDKITFTKKQMEKYKTDLKRQYKEEIKKEIINYIIHIH